MASFTPFPRLPTEIRHCIWLYSLGSAAQIVVNRIVDLDKSLERNEYRLLRLTHTKFFLTCLPAAPLATCHDARDFLLPLHGPMEPCNTHLPTWFSFTVDSVKCSNTALVSVAKTPWWPRLQRLTVSVIICKSLMDWTRLTLAPIDYINQAYDLKDLTIDDDFHTHFPEDPNWHWHSHWFEVLQDMYLENKPVSYYTRIINASVSEDKWLTPTNFARKHHELVSLLYPNSPSESGSDLDDPVRYYER